MKKQLSRISLFLLILLLNGCCKNKLMLSVEEDKKCNHKPSLLMKTDDYNVYTYCTKEEEVNISGNTISLKDYLVGNEDGIDRIIDSLNYVDTYYDGGTKVYNGSANLIACSTLDGNNDIYIGSSNMKYKANFCKNNNTTFIRTYKILKVKDYLEKQYEDGIPVEYSSSKEVTLEDSKNKEYKVIINNYDDPILKKGNTCEFEFMLFDHEKLIKDNPSDIFKNSQIVEIRPASENIINEQIK